MPYMRCKLVSVRHLSMLEEKLRSLLNSLLIHIPPKITETLQSLHVYPIHICSYILSQNLLKFLLQVSQLRLTPPYTKWQVEVLKWCWNITNERPSGKLKPSGLKELNAFLLEKA